MLSTAAVDSRRHRRPARETRRTHFAWLVALWALSAIATAPFGASAEAIGGQPSGVKAFIDRPGVYVVGLERLGEVAGCRADCPTGRLRLTSGDREVPHWFEDGDTGAARRVLFVADTSLFRRTDPRDARPLRIVRLTWDGRPDAEAARELAADHDARPGDPGDPGGPEAAVWRTLHLEEDVLRAAVTMGDADDIDTLWYWAMLTQQSSSQFEVEISDLPGPRAREGLSLEVTVRLLGWSRPVVPEGTSQHHVEVFLNDRKIGECEFDGRTSQTFRFEDVSGTLLNDDVNRLRVKIPERSVEGGTEPLIDIVYLDWIEVRYRAGSPLANGAAPLLLEASDKPRLLADPAGSPTTRLLAAAGWSVPREPAEGWVVPPGEAAELWIVDDDGIRRPLAFEPLSAGVGSGAEAAEYVMIAPPELVAGTERLAAFHRSLGRTVAVVDATAVYDGFGGGERSAAAIRRFLRSLHERTDRLRWVLLVGDADWFEPDDRSPYLQAAPADRNMIPAWTYLSRYGPAASDHFLAADSRDEAVPRFAVGRLPVVDAETLDAYVSKVIAWAAAPGRAGRPSMLMLSDSSKGSRVQQERMRSRLADAGIDIFTPDNSSGDRNPDDAALAAFSRRPSLVYFGGHGSRFMWELGDPGDPKPEAFLDRDDIGRLEPTVRQPVVLSISCATAPFDHPSADSLGEAMVLSGSRGAVAFFGASAFLHTPPRFAESLVRGLLEHETVGDALVAAKRLTAVGEVSYLYNLLGDPGLPLSAHHQDAGTEEQ